ncbi:MAG: HAD-IIIA family hydrolase [Spirochaetales bacterium]|nr:HAD-IIIA family hydrolase [Spirochaetales bacterium]
MDKMDAAGIIRELYSRGYKIGIVSNTVSRVLVPGEIEETGLAEYIDVLIMSSITNIRKPDPKMFKMAAEIMHVKPERSVYIGDKPNRDVEGPRRAGYRLTIVLENSKLKPLEELTPIQRPDIIIKSFDELLEIFR